MASADGKGNTGSVKRGSFKCTLKTKVASRGVAAKRYLDQDLMSGPVSSPTDQQDVVINSLLAEVARKAPATHAFLCQSGYKPPRLEVTPVTYQPQVRECDTHFSSAQTPKNTANTSCIAASPQSQNKPQGLTEDRPPEDTNTLSASVSELKKRFSNRIRKLSKQREHLDDSPLKSSHKLNVKPVPSPRNSRRTDSRPALPASVSNDDTPALNMLTNSEHTQKPSSRMEEGAMISHESNTKASAECRSEGNIIGEGVDWTNTDKNASGLVSSTDVRQKTEPPKPQPRKSSLSKASILAALKKHDNAKVDEHESCVKGDLNQASSQEATSSRDIAAVIATPALKLWQDGDKSNRLDTVASLPEEAEGWESVSDESDYCNTDIKRQQPARRLRKVRPQSVRNKRSSELARSSLTGATSRSSTNSVTQWTSVAYGDVVSDRTSDGWESDDDESNVKNSPKLNRSEIQFEDKTVPAMEQRVSETDEPLYLRENSVTDVTENVGNISNIPEDVPTDLPRLPRRITTCTSDSSESEEPSTPESPHPVAAGLPRSPEQIPYPVAAGLPRSPVSAGLPSSPGQTGRPSPSEDDELSSIKRPPLPPRKNSGRSLKGLSVSPRGSSVVEDNSKPKLPVSPETPPLPPRRISATPSHLTPPVLLPRKHSSPCMGTDGNGVRLVARKKPKKKKVPTATLR